jgi:hypothetical protein
MKYRMKVCITDPNTKEGMMSELMFKFDCSFCYDPDDYGKKTYLSITSEDGRFDNYYDLRYDENFRRDDKIGFLEFWARNYWTGENGAWAIKSLEITKA